MGEGGEGAFGKEVERWREEGWVREVRRDKIVGTGLERRKGRWWEGVGGVSEGLVGGLLGEVRRAGGERLEVLLGVTVSRVL